MQGDGFIVEPVTSVSGTSQVERGSPRVYGVLFRIFDDIFDGLFYVLKAACCFPLATKRSVSVSIRDQKDTANVNVNTNFEKKDKDKDKAIEKKIKFANSEETVSSLVTTVISKCSISTNSGSWMSSLPQADIIEDDYEYIEYRDRKSLKSRAGMIKNFFSKQVLLQRRGALKKYVPQLKFRRRTRTSSIVVPSSSSEVTFSKSKIRNVGTKIFAHQLAREMTLGPEVYPCLQSKESNVKVRDKSVGRTAKTAAEGKLKRTFSFFNDIYETNRHK